MQLLHTKKHFLLFIGILSILVLTRGFLFCNPHTTPLLTPLINLLTPKQMELLDINLYYSDQNYVRCYALKNDHLTLVPTRFASYTEGFMPRKQQQSILQTINTQITPHIPLNYFYNYYKDADYEIIAPIGNLSQIYFIDQATHTVRFPKDTILPLEKFYLNHVVRKNTVYYLLGDIVGEYMGICYIVDAASLQVIDSIQFQTSSLTIYKEQSSLNAEGHIFFTTQEGVIHIDMTHTSKEFIKLDFTPSFLVSQGLQTIALHLNNSNLKYAQLDMSLDRPIASGQLPLPEDNLLLIKATLQNEFLTLLTFSPTHPSYANYLLIYDLSSNQLIYCCALQDSSPYMALDFQCRKKQPHTNY